MRMRIGLLWFDDDPRRSLAEKISEAALRYREKFGVEPDTCYVNPSSLPGGEPGRTRLRIVPATTILPHHFWLGVEDGN